MAQLQAKVDAVKAAVSSTTSCTPTTLVTLKELLLVDVEPKTKSKTKSASVNPKASGGTKSNNNSHALLGPRERTALATHVINATLKSLAEIAKPLPPSTPGKHGEKNTKQTARRRSLRRSISAPLSPLQPRTLNRVATSPNLAAKEARHVPLSQSTGCLATVECARAAFACLRSIKGPVQEGQVDYQLENGMSVLVGRLLALGFYDQAARELRTLKRRLDGSITTTTTMTTTTTKNPKTAYVDAAAVAELLDFGANVPKHSLVAVTACQTQVIKLVVATKKPAQVEALLPALQESNPSSTIGFLSRLAAAGDKEAQKAARQTASLCQMLLSAVPSVSGSEDGVATEPRLSPDPTVAFELQALALRTQMKWWKLAGHHGDVDDEILSPLARCSRALVRRQKSDDALVYRTLTSAFESVMSLVGSQKQQPAESAKSALSSLYQVLGSTAHAARQYDDACDWLQRLRGCLCPETDFVVRVFSVSARTLAATLKRPDPGPDLEQLLRDVITGLDGSLSGTVTELNELLDSLSAARRSVVGLLKDTMDADATARRAPETLVALAKDFVLRYPRFVRRWLGTPPGKDACAKQMIQFDQRRDAVMQAMGPVLDAALTVLRSHLQTGSFEWQLVDDVLQHCDSLLQSVASPAKTDQLGAYHVKISNLYFAFFLELRRRADRPKDVSKMLLQALSRSIDTVKDRPPITREKAQLSTKLELFADLCREAGRIDDAVRTLRSICTNMAEDGVLSDVAAALASQPPVLAWGATDKAASLSRALRSIAKLDKSWTDWTFFLPEAERAAVLEHLMHLGCSFTPLRLHDPTLTALLRIYAPDRYPIRRLRVLLHVLYQNIGDDADSAELPSELDQALEQLQRKDRAEDAALCHYVPHLEAYHCLVSAMAESETELPIDKVKGSLSAWTRMAASCRTREDMYAVIDNPDDLLDHLQSLQNLVGLRGDDRLQLDVAELSVRLAEVASMSKAESGHDGLVASQSQLAAHQVAVGNYTQAMDTLERTKTLVEERKGGISQGVLVDFYLTQAECFSGVDSFEEALKCISKANAICSQAHSTWARSRCHATIALSTASLLQSTISLQKGDVQEALTEAKNSVRMLSHDWAKLETSSAAETNLSETSTASIDVKASRAGGPRLWRLASPLLRSLLHLSSVYAHIGLFQETVYYAQSACKVAEGTQSSLFKAQVSSWTGSVYAKADMTDKALAEYEEAERCMPEGACAWRVRIARQMGDFYCGIGDEDKAKRYLDMAEETIHQLSATTTGSELGEVVVEATASRATRTGIKTGTSTATRTKRETKMTTRTTSKPPATSRKPRQASVVRAKSPAAPILSQTPKDVYQSSLLTAVMLSRAVWLIRQEEWSSALSMLERVRGLPKLLGASWLEQMTTAASLIGQSMEQMVSDPVFSVVQESTLSLPAVCAEKGAPDRTVVSVSPPRNRNKGSRERAGPAFAEALRQAQALLMEAHGSALTSCDSGMLHRISALLQSTVVLLSATSAARAFSSGLATVAVDLGRNVAWARELNSVRASAEATIPRAMAPPGRRGSLDLTADLARFHKKYVEMIPKGWNVISLSLSDNRHDLCISKLQTGHNPFILRLPLERANSRDADSDVFNFEHGREELRAIVKLANETSHSARDLQTKGERTAWWAQREALDARLGDLVASMETTWLGGFRGIFAQHRRRADLLASFHKSFQRILDGALPSRRGRMRGKSRASKAVTLDPRILDLFVGLGDPEMAEADYDEALTDLLYFVVDILQFHGERNAYDEIDFDAMVVETHDALRGYYGAARTGAGAGAGAGTGTGAEAEAGAHTVLVLDKGLHCFPWESLPCMRGLSVSRVPSLACLRRLLSEASMPDDADVPRGHYVSAQSGTLILNPSSDLDRTQAFFQEAMTRQLPSWRSVIRREPRESELEKALSTSDTLLYFGHGSGAQYIRGRTIRRLDRCRPATFLMGCSSAALTTAGEFECHGPVWNYMMAGCPAVVGTLWDVTDRDIDRFAGRAFEEWGLVPRGTFAGELTRRSDVGLSLAEAVGRAREACRLKFLNGAAAVVYGIPVFVGRASDGGG
ncbi:hypothetical protein XA68_18381 [Ophiocordyceps unilateralis]|uniref:separase n=1 Tax=Ophiocordyceps unilateralis TaxID=268505 RepID=A0A2A9PJL4_OPHUN|nr:hypothetical protein XA68_18381 [Ophiocordyceps unilateralis]